MFSHPLNKIATEIAVLSLAIVLITACGQRSRIPFTEMNKFEEFKSKEKFSADESLFYTGVSDPTLKKALTTYINMAADDFAHIASEKESTDKKYQTAIKQGLDRITKDNLYLDTEDRERVCTYFEELMDIVGLESSDGHLNMFMYGFDPTK